MDPPDPLPVTLDPDAGINGDPGDDTNDSPGWPLVRPTREALDYLENALTTGIPKPTYDGPIRQPLVHGGRYPIDFVWTLPLETPSDTAQPTLPLHLMWDDLKPNPEPEAKTCSPSDLIKAPANDTRDTQASAQQKPNDLANTTSAQSPPRGTFSRPKPRGILREGSSDQIEGGSTDAKAQGKAAAKAPRRANPSSRRRTVKFQLPQDEAEPAPPETVQARPRFMVTIKSRAAARKWQELEQKPK